jgi:hypothetical protein
MLRVRLHSVVQRLDYLYAIHYTGLDYLYEVQHSELDYYLYEISWLDYLNEVTYTGGITCMKYGTRVRLPV